MATERGAEKKRGGGGCVGESCGMAREGRGVRGQPLTEEGKGRGGEEARKEGGREEGREGHMEG